MKGRKIADRRVRVERPHAAYFRYKGEGSLVAKAAASRPVTPTGRFLTRLKEVALGPPLASEDEIGQRLSKKKALAIFSSDAISSSAYATEEILRVLILAGAAALLVSIEIAIAIAVMLAMVALSYRQVCRAFPGGGGAYAVARSELTPLLELGRDFCFVGEQFRVEVGGHGHQREPVVHAGVGEQHTRPSGSGNDHYVVALGCRQHRYGAREIKQIAQ